MRKHTWKFKCVSAHITLTRTGEEEHGYYMGKRGMVKITIANNPAVGDGVSTPNTWLSTQIKGVFYQQHIHGTYTEHALKMACSTFLKYIQKGAI